MARRASVRQKNGYWYSEAGGVGRYFGSVTTTTQTQAMAMLYTALSSAEGEGVHEDSVVGGGIEVGTPAVGDGDGKEGINSRRTPPARVNSFLPSRRTQATTQKPNAGRRATTSTPILNPSPLSTPTLTVNALADRFLDWVKAHRGATAHDNRQRHLRRFRKAYGDIEAVAITGAHIEAFTETLRASGHAPDYIHKHLISVGAMFAKGGRKGWIPPVKPFATVEPLRLSRKALTEDALPTEAEVKALFVAADGDRYKLMGDLIRSYYNTGARTHELTGARVGDFQRQTRTIVLGHHKRSHTMREPTPRTIALNPVAYAILERRCQGRDAGEFIFLKPKSGKPMSRTDANQYFRTVRTNAKVRADITIYSFRHLYISELLMAGVDALLVARMAGTSVKMIETVYGHFKTSSYQDAQSKLDAMRSRI